MLRPHFIVALGACLATPVSLWAQTSIDNALGSICNSGPASLRALSADPLLSSFFEVTCGRPIQSAIGNTPNPITPPSPPPVSRAEDNTPVISAPAPQLPELRIDPSVAPTRPKPSESMARAKSGDDPPIFRNIELQGVGVTGSGKLSALVQTFVGKPITLDSLDQLTQSIQTWYRSQGMLARTLLPSQDLTDGRVFVTVVESKFTGVTIDDPKGLLRNTQVPKQLVESIQPVGETMSLSDLEEAASRLRDLSGVQTSIQLSPGDEMGQTKATVSVREGKASELRIGADNHGSRATGEERLSANLRINNVTQRGDSVSANLMKSEGLEYLGLGYGLPFTADGWRFEARASRAYHQLRDKFKDAEIRGPTENLGIGLVIPISRNSNSSIDFQTTIDKNKFKTTYIDDLLLKKYESNLIGLQIDGHHVDEDSRGQTQWLFQIVRGELDLSESTEYQISDTLTARTEGFFSKARASLTRREWINTKNTLTATAQAQWANKNLDGSEKFYLGGARGVRAYPANEAGGSLGHLSALEWETLLHQSSLGRWSLAGFYDHGKIRLFEDASNLGLKTRDEYVLRGYGFWVGTQAKLPGGSLGLRLTVAQRLGDNPMGLDSDGKRTLNRIRLDANLNF